MFKGYIALLVRKTVEGYSMSMSIASVGMPRFAGERGRMLDFRGSSSRALLLPTLCG